MQLLTGRWFGRIDRINLYPGHRGDNYWILYVLNGSDGKKFTTFEKNKADTAKGRGRLQIDWKLNEKNGKTITSIAPAKKFSSGT